MLWGGEQALALPRSFAPWFCRALKLSERELSLLARSRFPGGSFGRRHSRGADGGVQQASCQRDSQSLEAQPRSKRRASLGRENNLGSANIKLAVAVRIVTISGRY